MPTYVFFARDMSTTPPGAPLAGLAPSWTFLERLDDGRAAPMPPIAAVGRGQYKFSYDPEVDGEASGQVDLGDGVLNPSDRYVDLVFYLSDARTGRDLAAVADVRVTVPAAPAPVLDPAATAALIGPLVQVHPEVTLQPTPVNVTTQQVDLAPVLRELAAVEAALAALPDGVGLAVLRRLDAARAALLGLAAPTADDPLAGPAFGS